MEVSGKDNQAIPTRGFEEKEENVRIKTYRNVKLLTMDISSKIKRTVLEPKVYALLVTSAKGQILHLGVHYSLEEAYSSARQRMEVLAPHDSREAVDIQLWNSMSARQVIACLTDPQKVNESNGVDAHRTITPMVNGAFLVEGTGELPPIIKALLDGPTTGPAFASPVFIPEVPETPEVPEEAEQPVITTIDDHIQDVKDSKNDLIKKLIEEGDMAQVDKLKPLLGTYAHRLVLKEIKERDAHSTSVVPITKTIRVSKKQHKT
jgi:hypothetical protein